MSRRHKKARNKTGKLNSIGEIRIASRGYAFVHTPDGVYFVLPSKLNGAMSGDLVEVSRLHTRNSARKSDVLGVEQNESFAAATKNVRRETLGVVRRVIERAHSSAIGIYRCNHGIGVVQVKDSRIPYDIFLDARYPSLNAADGDAVVVQISGYPNRNVACTGYITEIITNDDVIKLTLDMIIRKHGITSEFPPALDEQLQTLAASDSLLPRKDLRERMIFTIDPSDAKDFDDALSVDYLDGELRVGVHIADVSAYVPWLSPLDIEARKRATSVYLPGKVIPMLPPRLSDDICSLKPDTDRLAVTVDLYFRSDGSIIRSDYYLSVIRSKARLSYSEVLNMLDATDKTSDQLSAKQQNKLLERLLILDKLAAVLAKRREDRGALEFGIAQPQIILNQAGLPESVYLRKKNRATALVEELMIAANESVAGYMLAAQTHYLYRVHDQPIAASLQAIVPILKEYGYTLADTSFSAQQIQQILRDSQSRQESDVVANLLLTAMSRAKYRDFWTEHFGLASQAYTHFTSPIRRYPDLMAHRLLILYLAGKQAPLEMLEALPQICEHCSIAEENAERATMEATKYMLCLYFSKKIGSRYIGVISGANTYGLYVREKSTYAEGFIAGSSIGKGYSYQPENQSWFNLDSNKGFRLGQVVTIELTAVDCERLSIDFVLR